MEKPFWKRIPHTYTIIFSLICMAAVLTWIVPAGSFERHTILTESGREVSTIEADSYHRVEAQPQTWQIFSAFFKGFQRAPGIIAFILILGGAFWVVNESKAIDLGVQSFLKNARKWERFSLVRRIGLHNLIIISVMLMFSFFGAVFGMSEETIAFTVIFVPLAISMGYDSIVGVCMSFIAAGLGFGACLLNPFTLGIAQDIAGVPLFSGIEYRFVMWMIVNIVGIGYVLRYAAKVRARPERSPMFKEDAYWRNQQSQAEELNKQTSPKAAYVIYILSCLSIAALSIAYGASAWIACTIFGLAFAYLGYKSLKNSMQSFALFLLLFTVVYLVFGVIVFEWGFGQIAALFMAMGLAAGFSMDKNADQVIKLFVTGAKDILGAALVVGLAGGIIVILEDGHIIDTFLHATSQSMAHANQLEALGLMYGFQSILNAIITSGTAKAAMLMPIFSEIARMLDISLQATVTAFHMGDGFTNLITPTSGVMIGVLEMAKIPYTKWLKWAWKPVLILVVLGFLLLIPTLYFSINGF